MLYFLMFVTALILTNMLGWNLIVAALVSVLGWSIVGPILGAILAAAVSDRSPE